MEYKNLKFANGVNLLLVPRKDTEVVTLLVYIGIGSRHEDLEVSGISHFLEHLLFDGTKKRPSAYNVSREIDALGASFNGLTTEELTYFYIKAGANHLDKIVDILSDMLLNSRCADDDIAKEKKVIIEEIKMYEDTPSDLVYDIFGEGIFAGNPLGRRIAGRRETISALDREKIIDYQHKHYFGKNFYICVSGNFKEQEIGKIARMIEEKFACPIKDYAEKITSDFKQKRVEFLVSDTKQTNLIAGFYAPAFSSPERTAARLLAIILGGNMSSRMFQEIRVKKGLAYFIRTIYHPFRDTGFMATHAGIANDKASEALSSILNEYQRAEKDITAKELKDAKNYLIGQIKIDLEDSQEIGYFYLNQLFYSGKIKTPREYLREIEKINVSDLKFLAKRYLIAEKLTVAAIGPENVKKDIEKIINSKKER